MQENASLYGPCLLSSQITYTCTYLAEHFAGLTQGKVQYVLKSSRLTPARIWQSIKNEIRLSSTGYLIFDDPVLNKEHSHHIQLVGGQYSGNVHG